MSFSDSCDEDYWGQYDDCPGATFAPQPSKQGCADAACAPKPCGSADDDFSRQSTGVEEDLKLLPLDSKFQTTMTNMPSTPMTNMPSTPMTSMPSTISTSMSPVELTRQDISTGELEVGSVVEIGPRQFLITGILGRGSFGTVWCGECCEGQGEVAIKAAFCGSPAALRAAEAEGALLRSLMGDGRHLPAFVAQSAQSAGPGEWHALLAMSRLPGERLLEELQGARRELATRFEGDAIGQVKEACKMARDLIDQLAPAMAHVSALALHRDAHAGNILVEGLASDERSFALVDFGLAVPTEQWVKGGWRHHGAAGDCRYWPPSAWQHFLRGVSTVASDEGLCGEYEAMLDFHSIGMTALQLFAVASAPMSSTEPSEASRAREAAFELQRSWDLYWQSATGLWKEVLAGLNEGRAACVKMELSGGHCQEAAHKVVARHLEDLRQCLRELKSAFNNADPKTCSGSDVATLVDILLRLIGGLDATLSWDGVCSAVSEGARSSAGDAGPEAVRARDGSGAIPSLVEDSDASSDDEYWASDQWDPDERVYVGAESGQKFHTVAALPEK